MGSRDAFRTADRPPARGARRLFGRSRAASRESGGRSVPGCLRTGETVRRFGADVSPVLEADEKFGGIPAFAASGRTGRDGGNRLPRTRGPLFPNFGQAPRPLRRMATPAARPRARDAGRGRRGADLDLAASGSHRPQMAAGRRPGGTGDPFGNGGNPGAAGGGSGRRRWVSSGWRVSGYTGGGRKRAGGDALQPRMCDRPIPAFRVSAAMTRCVIVNTIHR